MKSNSTRFSVNRIFFMIGAVSLLSFFFSANVLAEDRWWQRGRSLLKGFGEGAKTDELTLEEISGALKDALRIGTENVVSQLGRPDGFNSDAAIHIPLPANFQRVKSALGKVAMSDLLDDLELKLNRAAEKATPKAKALFWTSIKEMTLDDVQRIYKGSEDAATRYFKGKMAPAIAEEMRPIVDDSLSKVGAVQTYDKVMGKYRSLPFVPDVKADLSGHVVEKAMDGIFYYLAKEEAAIRKDPVKQTTELLKRAFGKK